MLKKTLLALSVIILAVAGGLYFIANREAHSQADRLIARAMSSGSFQELGYESLSVNLLTQDITLNQVKAVDLENFEYILQKVIISDLDLMNQIPHHINISIQGLNFPEGLPEIPVTQNSAFDLYIKSLLAAGDIPLILDYHYNYAPENNELIETDISIGLVNAADLTFNATINNIPLNVLANSGASPAQAQAQLMPYLAKASIPKISLSLEDLGIIDALMAIQAEASGVTPEQQRQQTKALVENLYLFTPQAMQNITRGFSTELASFIEGKQTLSISIEPEYNGSIQSLQPAILGAVFNGNYAQAMDLLHLDVRSQ